MSSVARGVTTQSTLHPSTQETLELYNLLQIGCTINVNDLEHLEAQRLIFLKNKVDEETERKNKKK